MNFRSARIALPALVLTTFLAACDDDPTQPVDNEQELITEVTLTFTPSGGGPPMVAVISDPDGEGPLPPAAQLGELAFTPGMTYNGTVQFVDRSDPANPEDITAEVEEEADEHRVFYTIAGMTGVEIDNLDTDGNGAPLGLTFDVVVDATASGTGTIQVVLSHFDDAPKGDGSTPSDETDADVTFAASVS